MLIAPSIDAFSPKNQELDADDRRAILAVAGLDADGAGGDADVHARGRQARPRRALGQCGEGAAAARPTTRRAPGLALGPR